jgi:hypothetical protein
MSTEATTVTSVIYRPCPSVYFTLRCSEKDCSKCPKSRMRMKENNVLIIEEVMPTWTETL